MNTDAEITAIYEDDLNTLLDNLNLRQQLEGGSLRCFFCKTTITFDNLICLFPDSGAIKICCDDLNCMSQLATRRNEGLGRGKYHR